MGSYANGDNIFLFLFLFLNFFLGGGNQTIKGTDQGGGGRVFVEDK